MLERIVILNPPDLDLGDLQRSFAAEAGPFCQVESVASTQELVQRIEEDAKVLIVIHEDVQAEHPDLIGLINMVRAANISTPVVLVADHGDVGSAAQAILAGACDYLVRGDHLDQRIATLLGKLGGLFAAMDQNRNLGLINDQLRQKLQNQWLIIGVSPLIKQLMEQTQRLAQIPRPILIIGERGTGKELVAQAIHKASGKHPNSLITVNCAAFNDALLESELFGHEKGAFTGAQKIRKGKFELAGDGTLFLDELGYMSLSFQQKILRVVEYGTFSRVGGNEELKTNARVIAATNVDLKQKIADGQFLEDLYDRIAFEVIQVPPLRKRVDDIEALAKHFLDRFALEFPALKNRRLSDEAINALKRYAFPGNVRELKTMIERAACHDTADDITPGDLGMTDAGQAPAERFGALGGQGAMGEGGFQEKISAYGKQLIAQAMDGAGGNQAQAARDLGLSYHQFRYYHKKYRG